MRCGSLAIHCVNNIPGLLRGMHKLLRCPLGYYDIEYEIDPWMNQARRAVPGVAVEQWCKLRDSLQTLGCQVEIITSQPKLPDTVFCPQT